jgi:hypothetical protein
MTSINDDGLADVRAQWRDQMHALLTASGEDTLGAKANRTAREHAPITIATVEC